MKKQDIINIPSIAYYSGYNGLEVKNIEYGIDDYLLCVSGAWIGKPKAHRLKIYYKNNGSAYVILNGHKIPLDECIRI